MARPLNRLWRAGLCLALLLLALPCAAETLRLTSHKSFADTLADLEFAITEHNFRITGRNEVGRAIRDRGHDTFPDATVVHYCNLELAHEVLQLDPHFIVHMPCRAAVYVTDGKVYVAADLLPEDHADERVRAFARRVNALQRQILKYATE